MTDHSATLLAQACTDALFNRDIASQRMGINVLTSGPGTAEVSMLVREDMIQGVGTCHGGYLFALADSAFAMACNTYNETTVALGCSIDYIAPGFQGDTLKAVAAEQSRGGRTGNYDVRIENQRGELLALFHGKSYKVRGTVLAQENAND
ncbi:hydroxyphenylacetyl-CoA thioesterase PaaI [Pseudomonas sp. EL_65y_Pfl2_R95]|uniref:hydroxyphenylacetyl-CoA thioesterase PaaI n=1 Tax=Pseudomonas sp. EL_65y_Pfl2_R95 TaxID=3088698 RepID=UPI0030D88296